MNLNEVKAVVTGGASGLGYAVASGLIQENASVVILDVNTELGTQQATKLGHKALFIETDVTNENSVQQALTQAANIMQEINVVINCAGILGAGRVLGKESPMPLEQFNQVMQVNLLGTFNVAKTAANIMQQNEAKNDNERGVIINTSSVAAYEGQIGQVAYSASKAGINGMTLPMAREFTRFGIRVAAIAPGVFLTPMVENMPESIQEALGSSVPFPNRLGKPEEFSELVKHIIKNAYINGTTIRLDGAIRLEPK